MCQQKSMILDNYFQGFFTVLAKLFFSQDHVLDTSPAQEDQRLVENAQRDPEQFGVLYKKYLDQIYRYIFYRTGQQADLAEELTAEVFTRALQQLSRFQYQGYPYSTYLYSVARSVCREWYGKADITDIDSVVVCDKHSEAAITQADISLLWKQVEKLPKKIKEMLELRFLEDLSYEEIAEIVHKKPGTVRTAVSRSLDRLQKEYAKNT
ncbi:MAG: hypothetical protein A2233_03965 [Candidatus Kerfeldbacteria bacterium RIFOXYA2_FULL_38_24]|uniref:RNA polymerase sigma factor n=1 Tax=Candidatus Kerfeldbacteria bacterium RIFOXYB2_FULL_38_14 TaxID=1798547 RepID=A0A1G2BDJ5_9BACT|nr:MAG: hypothetical protein A2233_03965 [Candidatus Kerfeldbacteria bacterium RIFOXYA2_FULL_38_24]OGY87221.1 MAG: hypothetical protein A2319_01085 [Candidatus Kerfeldbacteria bacterium RIFOXYB2_FULL_38_14]OGY88486.1 MAG: hypothetical protein A2458_01795 [Candidatus Kerfeldbacteria bacterium RIFOXYC2_FULL_38_9]